MFEINRKIQIGKYLLQVVEEVKVIRSVGNLADTCTIKMPVSVMNKRIQEIESKLKRGDFVSIQFGYDNKLLEEFRGYLQRIESQTDGITIYCEDEMFLFRKKIANRTFKNPSIKELLGYCINQLGLSLKLEVDYEMNFEKFTIFQSEAFDVLKKIQEETKANIYIQGNTLYCVGQYVQKLGEVIYDFEKNIETADLTWQNAEDKKVEIEIVSTTPDGKTLKGMAGTQGGQKITRNVTNFNQAALNKIAKEELKRHSYDGYEGKITGWLVPFVQPSYTARIIDKDYPERQGGYFVDAVETTISASGGIRVVSISLKLS